MDIFNKYTTNSEIHDNNMKFNITLSDKDGILISPEDAKNIETLILSAIDDILIYIVNKRIYLSNNKIKSSFVHDEKIGAYRRSINIFKRVFYRTRPDLMTKEEKHEVKETLKYCSRMDDA